jgi:hypothetical protein
MDPIADNIKVKHLYLFVIDTGVALLHNLEMGGTYGAVHLATTKPKLLTQIKPNFLSLWPNAFFLDHETFGQDRFWKYPKLGEILLRLSWQIGWWAPIFHIRIIYY